MTTLAELVTLTVPVSDTTSQYRPAVCSRLQRQQMRRVFLTDGPAHITKCFMRCRTRAQHAETGNLRNGQDKKLMPQSSQAL